MIHSRSLSLLIPVALTVFVGWNTACGPDSPPPPEITFPLTEDFTAEPASGWEWVRHNPEAVQFTPEGLRIRIEPGGLMGAGKSALNIFTTPIPEGARSAWVDVSHAPASQYEQAGLILYTDDDNYIKLVREYVDGITNVVCVLEYQAQNQMLDYVQAGGSTSSVGLSWNENRVEAYTLDPETNEQIRMGELEFPITENTRIGVFTQDGEAGADRDALFTDFVLSDSPTPSM